MIDISKTYRTRDGREVRIYATDGAHGKVHGAMLTAEGWEHRTWGDSGRIMLCEQHDYDLIEVRPRIKRTVWLNVYEDNTLSVFGSETRAKQSLEYCLACLKIDIDCEEGEGL